jgi:hypothetical protein
VTTSMIQLKSGEPSAMVVILAQSARFGASIAGYAPESSTRPASALPTLHPALGLSIRSCRAECARVAFGSGTRAHDRFCRGVREGSLPAGVPPERTTCHAAVCEGSLRLRPDPSTTALN